VFEDAWARRKTIVWNGVDVQVISFEDLCAAKAASGRAKDLEDLKQLEKFRPVR